VRPKTKDYTKWIKQQDEYRLKSMIIDQLPNHTAMTYEQRVE